MQALMNIDFDELVSELNERHQKFAHAHELFCNPWDLWVDVPQWWIAGLSHQEREALADMLCEKFLVQVDRFGSGNARHSGLSPKHGVNKIRVRPRPESWSC